jgi:hypothetical protein
MSVLNSSAVGHCVETIALGLYAVAVFVLETN